MSAIIIPFPVKKQPLAGISKAMLDDVGAKLSDRLNFLLANSPVRPEGMDAMEEYLYDYHASKEGAAAAADYVEKKRHIARVIPGEPDRLLRMAREELYAFGKPLKREK